MGKFNWKNADLFLPFLLIASSINDGVSANRFRRIVGGNNAEPGEIPWQASLRKYDSPICGGTIIGKRHILTAAHCIVAKAPYTELTIATGSNVRDSGKVHRIAGIVIHDQYNPRSANRAIQNDIAVISLSKDIEVNKLQSPVMLPNAKAANATVAIASGFGRTGLNEKGSRILKKFAVTVLDKGTCFEHGVRTRPHQICGFHSKGNGVCKGDSGGPLVHDNKVIGIVSTALRCGDGYPDTYTEVYAYLDFIRKAMKKI